MRTQLRTVARLTEAGKGIKQQFKIFAVLAIAVTVFLFPQFSEAITVGPAKMEYSVDPGAVLNGTLILINNTASEQTFYPTFEKFTEVHGEKQFWPGEPIALTNWLEMPESVHLNSGEKKEIPFVLRVPENAPPGGHFAVIWWGNAPVGGGNGASIVTRAGILVYLRVSGDIKEDGRITRFTADRKFFFGFPITFGTSFKNESNVYVKPSGGIKIKNLIGKEIITLPVNENGLQVLPESDKGFQSKWATKTKFAFGLYRAELDLVFGDSQKKLHQSLWFAVFPYKTTGAIILILIILLIIVPFAVRHYNRWIIKKYSSKAS